MFPKIDVNSVSVKSGSFGKFRMGRKSNHLMERVNAHLSKNGCRKSGLLADPELTDTLVIPIREKKKPQKTICHA
jgi:hypothetical protein